MRGRSEKARSKKFKLDEVLFSVYVYITIGFVVLLCLYPFLNVLAYSLSDSLAILSGKVTFYPINFQTSAYEKIMQTSMILNSLKNSVFITVAGTLLSLVVTTMAAYALSKPHLKGRAFFTFFILFTLYFGGGIIPTFMVVKGLGLVDSLASLVLPVMVSAFNFIIMKAFFQSLPSSIEESAKIDGCNDIYYLIKMALPLSKPIIATIGLFYAVMYWNDYFSSLMYITSPERYPLQLMLRQLLFTEALNQISTAEGIGQQVMPESMKAAAVVIAIIPIITIYPWLQKYFVKGVMLGSVKG
ncbi:carbohydrate ABC transporter permease [Cellulosilyticum sp. I15G10I2]|uniref:carbohydrate ABC transporter permease n=1 Tax=Cellulosilyticum sp. I15G10I2 TaxID=1892843 RepID=UPI00085C1CB2|nr:carbohydrate ABC transporter permease [Cellulosilyticum sp. I15G10I2]